MKNREIENVPKATTITLEIYERKMDESSALPFRSINFRSIILCHLLIF
jgi:hypothetical protein